MCFMAVHISVVWIPLLRRQLFKKEIITDERLREREKGKNGNNYGMFQKRWADHEYHEL